MSGAEVVYDLSADELATLIKLTPRGKSAWKWIARGSGRFINPRVDHDGLCIVAATADKFVDYSTWPRAERPCEPSEIARAIYDALVSVREQRQASARKAVATRAKRRESAVYQTARAYALGELTPRNHCRVCGRALTDEASRSRGVGPECIEDVIAVAGGARDVFDGWIVRVRAAEAQP